jgi:pyruvate dehydrogenase E2 component (dihydrolipoamide acetyltransferase)
VGDFTMPSLGADMEAGKITQWLVKPGDEVHRGDIVAVVQTDKSDIEVEIFEDGTIDELVVPEGERVAVGTILAHLATRKLGGANAPPGLPAPVKVAAPASEAGPREARPGPPTRPVTKGAPPPTVKHPAPVESPLVRHLAERLGVDLATLSGSGLAGVVTRADVERAAGTRATEEAARSGASQRPSSSPFARRLAGELGVDLAALSGTGPSGSVVEKDVRRAAGAVRPEEPASPPATTEDRRRAMQRTIGALMARSKREVPHYYLSTTIDLTTAAAWLEQANLERPVADRLVMATLLFSATARAVKRVPEINGFYVDGTFTPSEAVHLGVAISQRSGGLIAPAIHDAERISLEEMMTRVKDLVRRARTGVLRSSEMSDPTITVTNLGELGVDSVLGVIYPPQVAIVGFGRVREQPWAQDGLLGVRPCVVATLSGDHRVSDGMRGGRFLAEVDRLLQEPGKL